MIKELNHTELRKLWDTAGPEGYYPAMWALTLTNMAKKALDKEEEGELLAKRDRVIGMMTESEREAARGVLSDRRRQ